MVFLQTSEVEDEVLRHIGRCASACEFASSNWNQQLPSHCIGIMVKETTVYTGAIESYDYECVFAESDALSSSCKLSTVAGGAPGSGVKFTNVMGNEYGTKKDYSLEPRPDEVTHITLAAALQSRLTSEAVERINRVNSRFADSVTSLLKQLRLFSLA